MRTKSVGSRWSTKANLSTETLDYLKVHIEPLEERRMLAQLVYVNDNWRLVAAGSVTIGSDITDVASGITAKYGQTGFGKITQNVPSPTVLPGAQYINDAIDPLKVDADTGTVSILDGTYAESDIIIDVNVLIKGFANTGSSQTLIVPGLQSSHTIPGSNVVNPLGTNTHSAFLIYSPSVSISSLRINGSGNSGSFGTFAYHHGITTVYQGNDGTNTGTYSAVSAVNGPVSLLTPMQLGGTTPSVSPAPSPTSHVNFLIENTVVENTFYHGISLSARQNESYYNAVAGNPSSDGIRLFNNEVKEVGAILERDYQRVGIFLQNVSESTVTGNKVTNTGTGISVVAWNDANHGAFGDATAGGIAGFGDAGSTPFTLNTVTDAKTRGYDFQFIDNPNTLLSANVYSGAGDLAGNTTVGVYLNRTAVLLRGWKINGAYRGIEIQNTSRVNSQGNPAIQYPVISADTNINGPSPTRIGSVGILAQNGAGTSNPGVSELGPTPFEISGGVIIKGHDTAVRVNQASVNATASIVDIDRLTETGNNTGLSLGSHAIVRGAWSGVDAIVVTGANSQFDPGFDAPADFVNAVSPNVTPPFPATPATTAAPLPLSIVPTQPAAGLIAGSNLTLATSSTFNVRFTGAAASTLLDDFNTAFTYSSSPQVGISPWRTNGFKVAGIRGTAWNSAGTVVQNGTSGALKIRPNDPSNVVLGATEVLNGFAYHYFRNPATGTITSVNAAGYDTLEARLRLPSSTIDSFALLNTDTGTRLIRVGLIDVDNNARSWSIPARLLTTSASYTTVQLNLQGPSIVANGQLPTGSASFVDSDPYFNLSKITGWFIAKDNLNGNENTPFGIVVDNLDLLRANSADQLQATGNVTLGGNATLGGATLTGTTNTDFTPAIGQSFTIINNTGPSAVSGTFRDSVGTTLTQGTTLFLGGAQFQISYTGGTGNDVVLTVVDNASNNDPPTLDLNTGTPGNDNSVSYATAAPIYIAASATLEDLDHANLNQLIVDLELDVSTSGAPILVTGDQLVVDLPKTIFTDNPGSQEDVYAINGTSIKTYYDVSTGALTLFGSDTKANYLQALQKVQYSNAGGPSGALGSRTAVVSVSDGIETTTANLAIGVSASASPVLDLNESVNGTDNTVAYNDLPTYLAPTGLVNDIDSANMASLLVDLDLSVVVNGEPFQATGDSLFVDLPSQVIVDNPGTLEDVYLINGTSIQAVYNTTSGILSLTGSDTKANYQTVLRKVQYTNANGSAGALADRTAAVTLSDGTTTASANVTIVIDAPPVIDLDGTFPGFDSSSSYTGTPSYIAPNGTLTDADDVDMQSLLVKLELNVGTSQNPILVEGDHLTIDLPKIVNTDNPEPLEDVYQIDGWNIFFYYDRVNGLLTLSGVDTKARYIAALQKIQYYNNGPSGPMANRTAVVSLSDGILSSSADAFINVGAPVLDLDTTDSPGVDSTVSYGSTPIYIAPDGFLEDNSNSIASMTVDLELNVGTSASPILVTGDHLIVDLPHTIETDNPDPQEDVFKLNGSDIIVFYDNTTGILSLTGEGTKEEYIDALRKIQYFNNGPSGPIANRTAVVTVNDGAITDFAQVIININLPPTLDLDSSTLGNDATASYAALPVYVIPSSTLADPDDPLVQGLTVDLAAPITGDQLIVDLPQTLFLDLPDPQADLYRIDGTNILRSYDPTTGLLVLSGQDAIATYVNVMHKIQYFNNGPVAPVVNPTAVVTLNDGDATATANLTINVSGAPPASTVLSRQLFYNGSAYDAGPESNNDLAIATNKNAYFPGGGAMNAVASFPNSPNSFVHVSSYTRGINGLMVDISGLHPGITVSDFTFKVGANNSPSLWAAPSAVPNSVTVRTTGLGLAAGNTRVEIIWPNNSIRNTWLEVRVKANANTGLDDNAQLPNGDGIGHIFYFGNRVADSGSGNTVSFPTNATDEILARNNPGSGLPITNRFDYNKDGLVQATDQILVRNNPGILPLINIANPPAAPPAAPLTVESDGDGGESAIAAALASPQAAANLNSGTAPTSIASRLATVDLNAAPVVRLFEHLAERNTPRTRELLVAADRVADELNLEHDRLESILADLGL